MVAEIQGGHSKQLRPARQAGSPGETKALSPAEDAATDKALKNLENNLLDNNLRKEIFVEVANSPADTVSEDQPAVQSLMLQIDHAKNNQKRFALVDKLIAWLEKDDPSKTINGHHPTFNSCKAAVVFFAIRRACEKYNMRMSSDQLVSLMSYYYRNCNGGAYGGPMAIVANNALLIGKTFFPQLKQIAPQISDKMGLTGFQKTIFDAHLIYVQTGKADCTDEMRQLYEALNFLQPNRDSFSLHVITIAARGPQEEKLGSRKQYHWLLLDLKDVMGAEDGGEADHFLYRFEDTLGIRKKEELLTEIFFHEFAHNVESATPLLEEVALRIFNAIDGPVHDKNDIMGDYLSNHHRFNEGEGGLYAYDYSHNYAEFFAVYVEGMAKDTHKCLKIALERASTGNYVPLAMALLAMGALSTDEKNVYFLTTEIVNGEGHLKTERISKKDLLASIPSQYLEEVSKQFAVPAEKLLDIRIIK